MFYNFANIFNVWLTRRHLDSHICFRIQCNLWKYPLYICERMRVEKSNHSSTKAARQFDGGELFFQQMVLGQLDKKQKNEVEPLPHIIHKNEHKIDERWGIFFNILSLIDLLKYLRDIQGSLDHTLRTTHPPSEESLGF